MTLDISIHAPLRGRLRLSSRKTIFLDFNPRPLAGATFRGGGSGEPAYISIHAPLRGRRLDGHFFRPFVPFQSTPPCGGDMVAVLVSHQAGDFNPRPLAGATFGFVDKYTGLRISIHAPLRGRHAAPFFPG